MAKPSKRFIQGIQSSFLRKIPPISIYQNPHYSRLVSPNLSVENPLKNSLSGILQSAFFNTRPSTPQIHLNRSYLYQSACRNGHFPHFPTPKRHACSPSTEFPLKSFSYGKFPPGFLNPRHLRSEIPLKLLSFGIGMRSISSSSLGFSITKRNALLSKFSTYRGSTPGKLDGNFTKSITNGPLSVVGSAFSRYREAVGLQIEAFWKRNYLVLVGALGVGVCILLWRVMFAIASTFVGLSEGMAKYGFLALASAIVAFAGLYVRARLTINPDRIYRMAMRTLNTSAGILEVMGAPLTGTDVRAYVMSGGGFRLKNFKPRYTSKRCFLIFPIQGSERKGLVSVEVKKKKGQYDMKLLAVDIPMTTGPDQRLFLVGNEEEYRVGGGLISELRDPIVKALAAEKEFDDLDEKEEEEDAERELQEAERKQREEIEKLEKDSS